MTDSYTLNLDLPPQDRWTNLFTGSNKPYRKMLVKASWIPFGVGTGLAAASLGVWYAWPATLLVSLIVCPFIVCIWVLTILFFLARLIAVGAACCGRGHYYRELWGISQTTGVPLNLLLFMQFGYEWMSACTTVIVLLEGRPVMFRTMDWRISMLKGMTVRVKAMKNGQLIFQGVTWCGCVTLYTGISYHEKEPFGIAMNCRKTYTPLIYFPWNMFRFLQGKRCSGYAIRHVLEHQMSWAEATAYLSRQAYISPSYMTLVGNAGGRIMAHGRFQDDFHSLFVDKDDIGGGQVMCQPNHDWWLPDENVSWWQNLTHSLDRRDFVECLPTIYASSGAIFDSFFEATH